MIWEFGGSPKNFRTPQDSSIFAPRSPCFGPLFSKRLMRKKPGGKPVQKTICIHGEILSWFPRRVHCHLGSTVYILRLSPDFDRIQLKYMLKFSDNFFWSAYVISYMSYIGILYVCHNKHIYIYICVIVCVRLCVILYHHSYPSTGLCTFISRYILSHSTMMVFCPLSAPCLSARSTPKPQMFSGW